MITRPEWKRLTQKDAKRIPLGGLFVAHRANDNKAFTGTIEAVTDRYVELANGFDRELLYFEQGRIFFCVLERPENLKFSLAEAKLPFE